MICICPNLFYYLFLVLILNPTRNTVLRNGSCIESGFSYCVHIVVSYWSVWCWSAQPHAPLRTRLAPFGLCESAGLVVAAAAAAAATTKTAAVMLAVSLAGASRTSLLFSDYGSTCILYILKISFYFF